MSAVLNLWQELKAKSYPRLGHVRRVRITETNPIGNLTGVVSSESKQLLTESGVLRAMRTPGGQLRPIGIICETVNICNSDCVFCPYSLQTREFGTMAPDLFTEVCRQYVAMGGGPMSLTPVVGDVLLDKELPSRLAMLRRYSHVIRPSITTNLYALDRHQDEVVTELLDTFARVHISIYGITAEENTEITRRNNFKKFAPQARRLADLWERSSRRCNIWVSFRNLYDYAKDTLVRYVDDHFGHPEWFQSASNQYCNWGARMSGALPGDAYWIQAPGNQRTCMLLTTALQVYWDGRVSACSCCDYDAGKDLALTNVRENTLTEIYNGATNRQIWAAQEAGKMQAICQKCTFHVPLTQLVQHPPVGQGWFDFNGG